MNNLLGATAVIEQPIASRIKPFEAHNMAEFSLRPMGEHTTVNWVMHRPTPFISKIFQVFVSMDKMVGKDFEDSLAGLKAVAEN